MTINLIPNRSIKTVFDINISELEKRKVRNYFFDFDNTLMPWSSNNISEKIKRIFNDLKLKKSKIIIVTNGKGDRYKRLKSYLPDEVVLLTNMKKPNSSKLEKYMKTYDINPQNSVFIGDNLITDIYTANKIGMFTIKVKPIAFKEFLGTKIYRIIEIFLYIIFRKKFKEIYEKSNIIR